MRIHLLNNSEIVIQGNVNNPTDWENVQKVGDLMVKSPWVDLEYASADESEQWVHLCTKWDYYQATQIKEVYQDAKKAI